MFYEFMLIQKAQTALDVYTPSVFDPGTGQSGVMVHN